MSRTKVPKKRMPTQHPVATTGGTSSKSAGFKKVLTPQKKDYSKPALKRTETRTLNKELGFLLTQANIKQLITAGKSVEIVNALASAKKKGNLELELACLRGLLKYATPKNPDFKKMKKPKKEMIARSIYKSAGILKRPGNKKRKAELAGLKTQYKKWLAASRAVLESRFVKNLEKELAS